MPRNVMQLAMPEILDGIDMIPVKTRRQGLNPLKLSQTKLELLIQYLQDSQKPVTDPRNIALPQHLAIMAGLAMHEIAQVTSLWRWLLPAGSGNYHQRYLDQVNNLPYLIPTAKPVVIKRMIRCLTDPRLPMPKVRGDNFVAAKQEVYRIIAQYVLDWLTSQPPFIDTAAFPEFVHNQELNTEIPFPDPPMFNQAWYSPNRLGHNWSDKVHQLAQNLFDWHEDAIITPVDYTLRHGGAFHEVRYNSVYPYHGLVWSGRFDLMVFKPRLELPGQVIHLIDFKSGDFSLPGKDSLAYQIIKAAIWLSVQASLELPRRMISDGKAIRLFPGVNFTGVETDIKIDYISLNSSPPQIVSLDLPFAHTWSEAGSAHQMMTAVENLVARINFERERFAPILGEIKQAKEARLLRQLIIDHD